MFGKTLTPPLGGSDAREQVNALLGKGCEFQGKLLFEGTVRIDGKFSGEVFSRGKLVVGEGAQVEAEIEVDSLMLSGEIRGNVTARSRIEMHAPGKLRGNLRTPILVVEEGVVFEGTSQMEGAKESKETKSPPPPRKEREATRET